MKRVRLLVWELYYRTPLHIPIAEWVERGVARRCKLGWDDYLKLKHTYPEIWIRAAQKRDAAKRNGRFPPQPPQLAYWRKVKAKSKALLRKERPKFNEWAYTQFVRQRGYKQAWRRHRVLDRLIVRLVGW